MKKHTLAAIIATTAFVAAQGQGTPRSGLYDIAPDIRGLQPKNNNYIVGVNLGWDSDVAPPSDDDSISVGAYIGAAGTVVNNRSDITYSVRYGINYFLDDTSSTNLSDSDQLSHNISATLGHGYRINDRLSVSTKANLNYGLEPNYAFGIASARTANEVLSWSGDISVGYEVNRNFGIFTGVSIDGILFNNDDNEDGDRRTITPYIQGRYRLNNSNYLTAGYRHSFSENFRFNDSRSHFITLGLESKINKTTSLTVRAGAQIHEVSRGDTTVSPFLELGLRHSFNRRFFVNFFARYSISDFRTDFGDVFFAVNEDFRLGVDSSYKINRKLTAHGGIDYINNRYSDGFQFDALTDPIVSVADSSEDILHLKAGLSYAFANGLNLTGTVNHTFRDAFERTRLNLSASYSF